MKKVIFYQPINNKNKENINSGTLIRPEKMKEAFLKLDYKIIDINGSFKNRNEMISNALKEDADFAYFESNNTPLFLTCRNERKIDFISDFNNIKKLKQKMKVGYYCRDNFWVESSYFKKVGIIKGLFLKPCFFIEYLILIRLVDVMYVQSKEMIESFPFSNKYKNKFRLLPPACEDYNIDQFEYSSDNFNILYSGACDDYSKYNIFPLLTSLKKINNTKIFINSNFAEELFGRYPKYINDEKTFIMNLNYKDIDKHSQKYSAGIIYLNGKNKDIRKYLPIKAFYYLSLGLPILVQENTATGNFVKSNDIGWTYKDLNDLNKIINYLKNKPEELNKKHNNVIVFRNSQHWIDRAKYVVETLT